MLDDGQKMRDMQISFAAEVAPLGLQRGVEATRRSTRR